jgi:tetratricopeptide (TPR) repeat protein
MQNIQPLLSEGLRYLNANHLAEAEQIFSQILSSTPNEPNALYLLGGVRRKQNRNQEAKQYWQQSLQINRQQPQTLNALANLLKHEGNTAEAIKLYNEATTFLPSYGEAWYNLGLAYQGQADHENAVIALERANQLTSDNPAFMNAYGTALKDTDQVPKAIATFEKILEKTPSYAKAWHNLAIAYRINFEHTKALLASRRAINLAPKIAEFRYLEGNICTEIGDFDGADLAYRKALALQPDYAAVHVSLNKLYWEYKRDDLVGKSYEIGLEHAPQQAKIWNSYIALLEMANRHPEAETVIARASSHIPDNPDYLVARANTQARNGNISEAINLFEKALSINTHHRNSLINYAQLLIKEGDYEQALLKLEHAQTQIPYDQEIWAYIGLCWQLLGDARAEWLNDYDKFVQARTIPTPDGYSSLAAFLDELLPVIKTFHTSLQHPIDQTLRGGSQTYGKLLNRPHPLISKLKTSIEGAVTDYLLSLPNDPEHPLLSRKPNLNKGDKAFDFAASWSVWLREGGFHVNHVHSMGWISSALYLTVPENTQAEDNRREGWIKFGESGLNLGNSEAVGKFIKPQAGMLALFPSYTWHGTVPFNRNADRITAPFDVIPMTAK